MTTPCAKEGAIASLETNHENIMREISEIKSDVKEIKTCMSDLSQAFTGFKDAADYKYVQRKEFDEINEEIRRARTVAYTVYKIIAIIIGGGATSVAVAKYVLNMF